MVLEQRSWAKVCLDRNRPVSYTHLDVYKRQIVGKLAATLGGKATIKTYSNQRQALAGADFVVCCFQVGGYEPCTVTDFEVPKAYGLRQTIADTLGTVSYTHLDVYKRQNPVRANR